MEAIGHYRIIMVHEKYNFLLSRIREEFGKTKRIFVIYDGNPSIERSFGLMVHSDKIFNPPYLKLMLDYLAAARP